MVVTSPEPKDFEHLSVSAQRLTRAFDWLDTAKDMPVSMALATATTIWFQQVDAFRKLEEELLENGTYEKELEGHRVMLTQLISEGEKHIRVAKMIGVLEFPSGFTLQDLEATIDSLRVTFRCQHGQKNSQKVNDTIARLLDVA